MKHDKWSMNSLLANGMVLNEAKEFDEYNVSVINNYKF